MSDVSQGEGWWQASDGKWYPPHQHPDAKLPPPPPAGYAAPPGSAAGPPAGYPPPAPTTSGTSGFAIASMVLGIIWIWGIGSILALVFGYKARREIDQSAGRQTGRGMAIAGIVLGWIGIAGAILLVVLVLAVSDSDSFDINSDPSDGFCNEERFLQDPDC